VFSATTHNLPFVGGRFRDVGGTGSFIRVVDLVSIVRGRVEVAVEVEGRFPCVVEFRVFPALFLEFARDLIRPRDCRSPFLVFAGFTPFRYRNRSEGQLQ
jgi:hypothetical protein